MCGYTDKENGMIFCVMPQIGIKQVYEYFYMPTWTHIWNLIPKCYIILSIVLCGLGI